MAASAAALPLDSTSAVDGMTVSTVRTDRSGGGGGSTLSVGGSHVSARRAWRHDKRRAIALLAAHDKTYTREVPNMLQFWVSISAAHYRQPATRLALTLAVKLNGVLANQTDPLNLRTLPAFPLGLDAAVLAVLPALLADVNEQVDDDVDAGSSLAVRYKALVRALADQLALPARGSGLGAVDCDGGGDGDGDINGPCAATLAGDISDVRQLVLPVLLGFETPVTVPQARELQKRVLAHDEAGATKLAAAFSRVSVFAAKWGGNIEVPALVDRLKAVNTSVPALLYRALHRLGCIGPAPFSSTRVSTAPEGFLQLSGSSLALAYAQFIEDAYEGSSGDEGGSSGEDHEDHEDHEDDADDEDDAS